MRVVEWSDAEIGKLTRLYTDINVPFEEITAQLPGRTMNSIRLKASRLRLHRENPEMLGISELNWIVHEKGDRLLVIWQGLTLSDCVRLVMESEDLEATGYEKTKAQVTIKRVANPIC